MSPWKAAVRCLRKGDSMTWVSGLSPLYYGWVLVFTLALTETTSWGILYYAFTVFLTPMRADLG
jgi:hypothetical protein